MFKQTQWQKTGWLLMILSMGPFLTACGGEEGQDDSAGSSANNGGSFGVGLVCFAYLLVSGDDECLSYLGSSSSSGGSGNSGDCLVAFSAGMASGRDVSGIEASAIRGIGSCSATSAIG